VRPVPPIAATEPGGEASRLDEFRGRLARDLLERLPSCDADPELGEAVDRWELSLFAEEPFRSELLRESLAALLGGQDGLWPPRRERPCSSETVARIGASSLPAFVVSPEAVVPGRATPTSCAERPSRS
jgi:hypothetical protein